MMCMLGFCASCHAEDPGSIPGGGAFSASAKHWFGFACGCQPKHVHAILFTFFISALPRPIRTNLSCSVGTWAVALPNPLEISGSFAPVPFGDGGEALRTW